jgi:hypothetical protein
MRARVVMESKEEVIEVLGDWNGKKEGACERSMDWW